MKNTHVFNYRIFIPSFTFETCPNRTCVLYSSPSQNVTHLAKNCSCASRRHLVDKIIDYKTHQQGIVPLLYFSFQLHIRGFLAWYSMLPNLRLIHINQFDEPAIKVSCCTVSIVLLWHRCGLGLAYNCGCVIIDTWNAGEYEIKLGSGWDYLSAYAHVSADACVWSIQNN